MTATSAKTKRPASATGTKAVALAAASPAPDISISAKPRRTLTIDLVGVTYRVKAPKTAFAMGIAEKASNAEDNPAEGIAAIHEWVSAAFGPKQAPGVLARLQDEDDDLDIGHLMELMEKLMEAGSGGTPTS